MYHTETAGGIVLNSRGEVALVCNGVHEKPWWGFPKGHVDLGEDALTAARREIEEETGLRDLALVRALPSYERYRGTVDGGDDTSELKMIHMFLFKSDGVAELVPQDQWNPEARWVAMGEVENMLAHPKDRAYFRSILGQVHSVVVGD